ncbi:MAG: cation:proton antiporter [Symploca sp. SIO2B6]|nr:cation:proton antiporter [Symploca sp. SIO2B6]
MNRYLDVLLRLSIWFLLTADISLANSLIGLCIALLLPRSVTRPSALKEWVRIIWKIIIAIPQAYIEAIEMMIRPHYYEEVVVEKVKPNRTPGLIFLDIFLITFTPKTIVLNYHKDGWYAVHYCTRKMSRSNNSDRVNALAK